MERKVGQIFSVNGYSYVVKANDVDVPGWFRRRRTDCNSRCAFWNGFQCMGALSITGDCQDKWRNDKRSVFFENAAFARSPLEAAAANSAKNRRKSYENPT